MSTKVLLNEENSMRESDDKEVDVELSVIIAVRDPDRAAPMEELYDEYKRQIEKTGQRYEFIFAVEGDQPKVIDDLRRLKANGEPITILVFAKWYGDSTVLAAGFEHASGGLMLTLPAYHQIEPQAIPSLFSALQGNDMVVVRRGPRVDGTFIRFQVRVFHSILRGLLGFDFQDLGCSVRLFKKDIVQTVSIYGDQHRFFPVLAQHYGYKIREIEAPQTKSDTFQRDLRFGTYINRLLDLLSILFLTKFTKKPLRFFGFTGLIIFGGGFGVTLYLTIQRLFMGVSLADKPMLLLGILLIVLGTLFFAIGLIGEMIIFTHSDKLEGYVVEEVVN